MNRTKILRLLTFLLACWMSCAVCVGLSIAAVAGVAYGYNYQMAEWLTFTRSDVTVYMRRGQFYDRPDVKPNYISRRSNPDDDAFKQHIGGEDEYVAREQGPPEDARPAGKALPESWQGIRNAEHLVDKMRRFNNEQVGQVEDFEDRAVQMDMTTEAPPTRTTPLEYYKLTRTPSHRYFSKMISMNPNPVISTAVIDNGDSKIIMRNFQVSTMKDVYSEAYKSYPEEYMDRDRDEVVEAKYEKGNAKDGPVMKEVRMRPTIELEKIREGDPMGSTMVMRHWGPTSTPTFQDYTDSVYEDSNAYRVRRTRA